VGPAGKARWDRAIRVHLAAEERLAEAVRASTPEVVEFVRGLRDTERRELAGPVRAAARELVGRDAFSNGSAIPPEVRRARAYLLRVAGAGCFTGADATAAWLARGDLQGWSFQLDPDRQTAAILEVLRDRDPNWLADVARRLAGRLRPGDRIDRTLWATTSALVRHTGIDPPTTEGFVHGWVVAHTMPWAGPSNDRDRRPLMDRLRDDPFLEMLVPRLFEVDEVGPLLLWGVHQSQPLPAGQTWPGALAQLAAEGWLDRAALLDRCLGRLLRGGRPGALGGFVALHEALDPNLDELAARTRDYHRLLPDAPTAVAELAQRVLRRLDDAGRLDRSVLIQASRAVLFRTERKLVRAQLAWLDVAARRQRGRPEELGELLGVVAVAFGQDSAQLQERALSLLRRHARHASPAGRVALLHAAEALPADLRRRLGEVLGEVPGAEVPGEVAGEVPGEVPGGEVPGEVAPGAPGPPAPRALPPPIATPAELAEELSAMLEAASADRVMDETLDPVTLERVLAALVTFAHGDRVAVHEAIAPVLLHHSICPPGDIPDRASWEGWSAWLRSADYWYWYGARMGVALIAAAAAMSPAARGTGPAASREAWLRLVVSAPGVWRRPRPSRARQAMIYRLREIGTGLLYEPVPALLSTPATAAGHIDPDVLVDKLDLAENDGWQPWEIDLQQALLRLPRETGGSVLDRARRLRSPAGKRLAERLETGGPADPALDCLVRTDPPANQSWAREPDIDRTYMVATRAVPQGVADADQRGRARPVSPDWVPSLVDLLFDLDPPERLWPDRLFDVRGYDEVGKLCWPALLPSHRDLAAAHLLPALSGLPRHPHRRGLGAVLPALAEGDGPVGTALTLALAQGLGAGDRSDRAAAADALVILAGRRQLDGAPLGLELARLIALGLFPVQRLLEPLRDVAMAGAHAEVWATVAAALPRLLPPAVERAPQRLAGLVALGSETATLARAAGPIPAISAIAERGGSSQLAAESRRLHQVLASSSP
jgi:hypothetical protein